MSLITWGRIAGQFKPVSVQPHRAWNARADLDREQRKAALAAVFAGRSYGDVARSFNVSRNVIAGLVYRAKNLGVVAPKRERRSSPAPKGAKPIFVTSLAKASSSPYEPAKVSIFNLGPQHCRWPLWATDAPATDKFYCGNKVDPGRSYCSHCYGLSYSASFTRDIDRKLGIKHLAGRIS
jgi:hypothetical protein